MSRRKRVITLRIDPEMHAALRKAAHQYCTSMNLLIERACVLMLSQANQPGPRVRAAQMLWKSSPTGCCFESVKPDGTEPDQICKVAE